MGNAFVHIELATDDLTAAKSFYKTLFDWKLADMPGGGMEYTMLDVGKGTGGGMMKKPMAEAPTAWTPYVAVEDVSKTLEKAKDAGARVVVERTEIGGGMGAFGVLIDPTGAALGVWEMAKKAASKKKAPKKKASKKAKKPAKKKKR
jgi:predicted enzyme related to lactoylglutathione lyase